MEKEEHREAIVDVVDEGAIAMDDEKLSEIARLQEESVNLPSHCARVPTANEMCRMKRQHP